MKQLAKRLIKAIEVNTDHAVSIMKSLADKDKNAYHEFRDRFFNMPEGFSAFLETRLDEFDGESETQWNEFVIKLWRQYEKEKAK